MSADQMKKKTKLLHITLSTTVHSSKIHAIRAQSISWHPTVSTANQTYHDVS